MKLFQMFLSNQDDNSIEHAFASDELSLTKQSFKEEADINTLVQRFGLTGQLPDMPLPEQYGDFSGAVDFQTSMELVRQAAQDFLQLPAELRERFRNDPQMLMTFLSDQNNRQEAIDLGLLPPPPLVAPIATEVVNEALDPRGKPDIPVGTPADFSRQSTVST
ncbi:MAG: internal scaffolding protein [Microvirus sp.]|nr:MAG: internal scaffolding protein [Microvirus sp.]